MKGAVYWVVANDPTPEELALHKRGSVLWCECQRCGDRAGIALPTGLGTAGTLMRAIVEAHQSCAQSLRGARWELIVELRKRRLQLERAP